MEIYSGIIIICIFLDNNQEKFIASFGDFTEVGVLCDGNEKTIKTIRQYGYTRTNYGWLWNSYTKSYVLQIECADSSVIRLTSEYPFKIYNSYDEIHAKRPYEEIDLDHNY